MGQSQREIADGRAHTDASLNAERAPSDAERAASVADARRLLDDLIERDRILADIKLVKFRDSADRTISHERSDAPSPTSSEVHERDSVDERTAAERNVTDRLLQRERQRSDVAVETERSEQDAQRVGLEALRHDTDDQLSTERRGADTTATALGETRTALAEALTKEGRQQNVLGAVAHDLRSPLSVISLSAESIAEAAAEPAMRAAATAILLASVRMDRLVSDLLDVVRIESGTLRIVKRSHDIGAFLGELFSTYKPMFAVRNITFTVAMPKDGTKAFFDHDRIVQVFSNLLGNAMKFTEGGGTVAIGAEPLAKVVAFTVRDNGPGIPKSAMPHVFERFWQIDSTMRRGLGLGLHICEKIVQEHGGRIWVESPPGEGATFRFTLPMTLNAEPGRPDSGTRPESMERRDP